MTTPADLFASAESDQLAGRLDRAADSLRALLALAPDHAPALRLLGALAQQRGRPAEALGPLLRATGLAPADPHAHSLLGAALHALGRHDEALPAHLQALALAPDDGLVLNNLGIARLALGQHDEAARAFTAALRAEPNDPGALCNLGAARAARGHNEEAAELYRRALSLSPTLAPAHNNLGNLLRQAGNFAEAEESFRAALRASPGFALARHNLAQFLAQRGRPAEAEGQLAVLLDACPDDALARARLGHALLVQGRAPEALACCEQAMCLAPDQPECWNSLGNARQALGEADAAEAAYARAAQLAPDWSVPRYNRAVALLAQGRPADARASLSEALALAPRDAVAHSTLVASLHFDPTLTDDDLRAAHREWAERHAGALPAPPPHANVPDPARRLRLGYVSPDLRNHAVAFFLEPLLANHDPATVMVFCYAEVQAPDETTARLRALAHAWRDTAGLTDDELAALVRRDAIDVLIDLAGHTAGNRLLAFARSPAPVQLSYLGYPGPTGLPALAHRLVDAITEPVLQAFQPDSSVRQAFQPDSSNSQAGKPDVRQPDSSLEQPSHLLSSLERASQPVSSADPDHPVYLPAPFCCYAPPRGPAAEPSPALPEDGAGALTFGALHKLEKLNDQVVRLWCDLLAAVPGARLLLARNTLHGPTAERLRQRFADAGLAPERLLLERSPSSGLEHLRLYGRIDVALDAFPFGGHTTACEALWMGVPVVSLRGTRHAGRMVASVLAALGLADLVADSPADCVRLAAALAADRPRRAELRAGLRPRMLASPLCDGAAFARSVESAFRDLWGRWCAGRPAPPPPQPAPPRLEGPARPLRYLLGPASGKSALEWEAPRRAGLCRAFNGVGSTDLLLGPGDTWDGACRSLPDGWRPDFVLLDLDYASVPPCLWSAPVPLVALAPDWQLQWHFLRRVLPLCDLVLTDALGVEVMRRAGIDRARRANLFGLRRLFLQPPAEGVAREIDVLFVGNLHPAVQRERMPWLGRIAHLAHRWNVQVLQGPRDEDYRKLLGRARIVFNRSIRGECNLRTFEAPSQGALLFQERGNREAHAFLRDRQECVYYDESDLEGLLEHYLTHEEERRALADAGRARALAFTRDALWLDALALIEAEWPALLERSARRPALAPDALLLARTWQETGAADGGDPTLQRDLASALAARPDRPALHNARGLVEAQAARQAGGLSPAATLAAADHFRRAVASGPGHAVAALNLLEALSLLATPGPAGAALPAEGARRLLAALETQQGAFPADALDVPHFPPAFDYFRVEWERAAWANAGRPVEEERAKLALLRWRLHALAGELAGDLSHFAEAARARPDLPPARAALGCAFGAAGRFAEAVPHLAFAVAANPFDLTAARALYQASLDSGDVGAAGRVAADRLLLHRAAPGAVLPEPWFVPTAPPSVPEAPAGPVRTSLCIIARDEEENLPNCLRSVAGLFDEVVVLDTGSTDRTKEVALALGARVFDFAWCDDFSAARNACLDRATGDWILWMDCDDVLDEDNRAKLRALLAGLGRENVAYAMKCLCLPSAPGDGATVVDHVRLFRRLPGVRWSYRVHEQILPAVKAAGGCVRWSDVTVHHTGYQDAALRARKLERDLRLLGLALEQQPDDPFTLFNLGSAHHELGRPAEALPFLRRSLELSSPGDSIVRKLYALQASCHAALRQPDRALALFAEGRRACPDDSELLFAEASLRLELGDLPGARALALALLQGHAPGPHFASVAPGLRTYRARHLLAAVCRRLGQFDEAEGLLRAALAECPGFLPALADLGHLCLDACRWEALASVAAQLAAHPRGELESALLLAQGHLARREHDETRALLGSAIERWPEALPPRVLLGRAFLLEGGRPAEAEHALREVLRLAPTNAEARHNLRLLVGEP